MPLLGGVESVREANKADAPVHELTARMDQLRFIASQSVQIIDQ